MKGLDVVIVLSQGMQALERAVDFGNFVDQKFRLLFYRPLKEGGEDINSVRNKDQWSYYSNTPVQVDGKGGHCWNFVEAPFHIYPLQPSFEEYLKDPIYRLSDEPISSNFVVMFDDFYSEGNTFRKSVNDFVKMGYSKEDIFFHSLSQEDISGSSLTLDGNNNYLDLWKLRGELKDNLNR